MADEIWTFPPGWVTRACPNRKECQSDCDILHRGFSIFQKICWPHTGTQGHNTDHKATCTLQ